MKKKTAEKLIARFRAELFRDTEADRLTALEQRVRELEAFPDRFAAALRERTRKGDKP